MFYVIQTNRTQSRIIKIKNMGWKEFKNKIINQKEDDPVFEIHNSTMRGCILPRFTKISEIPINDDIHLEIKFKIWNGDNVISHFYKVGESHFEFIK